MRTRVRWHATVARGLPLVAVWALLWSCAPATVNVVAPPLALPPFDAALARPGPHATALVPGQLRSVFGCRVDFELHRPVGGADGATVVMAHGFLRSLASMRGWAEHLASHGVATAVVSFCNSTPFAGRHDRNAVDLRAVADAVRPAGGAVLYAGFSAGGLAALLAAGDDPDAVALLALDAVDSGGLAVLATGLTVPALFLAAEPSSCNAQGNMLPLAAGLSAARIVPVPNATHCHFEDPYAVACERLCGRVEPPEAAEAIRDAIRALATEWVLEQAGRR